MQKDIDKFIQNCYISKKHNIQKQSYSYINMDPSKWYFNSKACNQAAHPLPSLLQR